MRNRRRAWCSQTVEVSSLRSGPGHRQRPRFEKPMMSEDSWLSDGASRVQGRARLPHLLPYLPSLSAKHAQHTSEWLGLWRLKVMTVSAVLTTTTTTVPKYHTLKMNVTHCATVAPAAAHGQGISSRSESGCSQLAGALVVPMFTGCLCVCVLCFCLHEKQ